MQGKIALEDHFAIEATLSNAQVFGPDEGDQLRPRLLNAHDMRLREMDRYGVEMMILSLNAPAVQAIHDVKRAIAMAREANDVLAIDRQQRHLAQHPLAGAEHEIERNLDGDGADCLYGNGRERGLVRHGNPYAAGRIAPGCRKPPCS